MTAGRRPAQAPGLSADEIARRIQDRDTGRDGRSTMRMRLFDRHGRARERALTMTSLRGRGTRAPRRPRPTAIAS